MVRSSDTRSNRGINIHIIVAECFLCMFSSLPAHKLHCSRGLRAEQRQLLLG